MSSILIPPSTNWFSSNSVHIRNEDNLMAVAAFKNIVIYKIKMNAPYIAVFKMIQIKSYRVQAVCLYTMCNKDVQLSNTVVAISDQSINLYNFTTGVCLNSFHVETVNIICVCWGTYWGDEVVLAGGKRGSIVAWHPKHSVSSTITFGVDKSFSIIKTLPSDSSQVLVAHEKDLLLLSLRDKNVLMQLKGHNTKIYCMEFYLGQENPFKDTQEPLPVNTRWKRDDIEEPKKDSSLPTSSPGPFLATSDLQRNVLIWDLTLQRYIAKLAVPTAANNAFKKLGKEKASVHYHISLSWQHENLLSSTVVGEVLQWSLTQKNQDYKVLYQQHQRAIYNLCQIGGIVVSFSQDRKIIAFNIQTDKVVQSLPTLGSCASTMAFCPHDDTRLAVGNQDGTIWVLSLGTKHSNVKQNVIQNGIKGRVHTLSWHPSKESCLLFGTSDGQVGVADIYSYKVNVFSKFHKSTVYKVEWAPPVKTQESDEAWLAYSLGNKDIYLRSPSNIMNEPLKLSEMIEGKEALNDITEFAFSPDFKFMALGSSDGNIHIVDSKELRIQVVISAVRKSIQHLCWKPPTTSEFNYTLAVGSGECSAYVFALDDELQTPSLSPIVHCSTELSGHTGRVVWVSWSQSVDGLLATASYDHTVQIWDANNGIPLGNYGGHCNRVFRVEFSPSESNILSFAEENSIHIWRQEELTHRTPQDSLAVAKETAKKCKSKFVEAEFNNENSDLDVPKSHKKTSTSKDTPATCKEDNLSPIPPTASSTVKTPHIPSSTKKNTPKSFFPVMHSVMAKKKSFLHACILCMLRICKMEEMKTNGEEILDEKIDGEEGEEKRDDEEGQVELNGKLSGNSPISDTLSICISSTLQQFSGLLNASQEFSDEDVAFVLDFFSSLPQLDKVLGQESDFHDKRGTFSHASHMSVWRGSLDEHIRACARLNRLDPFLVAAAPQVSHSLWRFATESYAQQLAEEGDYITAATFYVNVDKVDEAVSLLLKHQHFREAYAIAKCKSGYDSTLLHSVVNQWATTATYEGNFEMACLLYLSINDQEAAARVMSRRTESSSLWVSSELHLQAGNGPLAHAMALMAVKDAALKQEFAKCRLIVEAQPIIKWFQVVNDTHEIVVKEMQDSKNKLQSYLYRDNVTTTIATISTTCESTTILPLIYNSGVCNSQTGSSGGVDSNDTKSIGPTASIDNASIDTTSGLLNSVRRRIKEMGLNIDNLQKAFTQISTNLPMTQMPSSLKSFVFLLSTCVAQIALQSELYETANSATIENREDLQQSATNATIAALHTAAKVLLFWTKAEHVFCFTLSLFCNGIEDMSVLGPIFVKCQSPSTINELKTLYYNCQIDLLKDRLTEGDGWLPYETEVDSKLQTDAKVGIVQETCTVEIGNLNESIKSENCKEISIEKDGCDKVETICDNNTELSKTLKVYNESYNGNTSKGDTVQISELEEENIKEMTLEVPSENTENMQKTLKYDESLCDSQCSIGIAEDESVMSQQGVKPSQTNEFQTQQTRLDIESKMSLANEESVITRDNDSEITLLYQNPDISKHTNPLTINSISSKTHSHNHLQKEIVPKPSGSECLLQCNSCNSLAVQLQECITHVTATDCISNAENKMENNSIQNSLHEVITLLCTKGALTEMQLRHFNKSLNDGKDV